ncbi:LLM class flavin-dependent oxidoreductase [Rhodalgimonas zhirmunskyi]|uniref:Luciferase-like monooxygenase n=1 Tax=Rhodalgimonas zhirmunskyi TaxID=2964767 RepID=A0AAJ1X5U5_9RHOB|nr:LLM class flavin-dependent oxidoreductase [Rhodoalgimonas zhirmunskyi]MDQ2092752.1 LLM class flavin-dependent oxidoreductase [Rhodoalgimonas zhirmunskyi]
MIPHSILDLVPIPEGGDAAGSIRNSTALAQRAEALGYSRYWLAEHHNMPGIASSATTVLIGHIAASTSKIRVGSGGIMLPNHAPLVVAEQFGTLATIHGDRFDLGLGRAPGTDGATMHALRRGRMQDNFPEEVIELIGLLNPPQPGQHVRAIPGEGTQVPVWILGSSLYGAQLAAHLGLPYAFASHFAPAALEEASEIYRRMFQPGITDAPRFMLAVNAFAAETEAEARLLRSSQLQGFVNLRSGMPGPLPAPRAEIAGSAQAIQGAEQALSIAAVGTEAMVGDALQALVKKYQPDELILSGQIHDPAARIASFEIAARALAGIG